MQESGGRGTDSMQSSESPYNTRYSNSPNAIQQVSDPGSRPGGIGDLALCDTVAIAMESGSGSLFRVLLCSGRGFQRERWHSECSEERL